MYNTFQKKKFKIRLLKRQQIWTLTSQGWVVILILVVSLILGTITHLHSFLAVNAPIKSASLLVVEGWVPDYAIKQAKAEFESSSYHLIITTGGPLEKGSYLTGYKNYAEVSSATFIKLGLAPEKLATVPAPAVIKNRSYASVVELQRWLLNSNLKIKSMNLLSWDAHARRSWLLFKKVFSPQITVGVIASSSIDYEPNKWWVSSAGVRTVIDETIAYIYAVVWNWKA